MRVIAGSAKRLLLTTVEGLDTRPTTDRIKETLFNMLSLDIPGCLFLDLFSGSGAIAIEALSRGAKRAVLVENNPKAVRCIRDNLRRTRLEEGAQVMECDAAEALRRLSGKGLVFDVIFMDPPYNRQFERRILEALRDSDLADGNTLIVVEASKETDFSWLDEAGYELIKNKEYKTNRHVFARKREE